MDINSFALGYSAGKKKGGGGVELNIAYGETPPEDTSKLWVKTAEPNGVLISPEVEETEVDGESYYTMRVTLPYPLAHAGCGAIGSKIYIIGGTKYNGSEKSTSKSVLIYDTEKRTFEELKDVLGEGITYIKCAVVGTRIYFVGGGATSSTTSKKIRYFDTVTKQLVVCNSEMPTALYGFACESIENTLYIFSGSASGSYPVTAYRFETETDALTAIGDAMNAGWGHTCRKGSNIYLVGLDTGPSYVNCYNTDDCKLYRKTHNLYYGGSNVNLKGCVASFIGDFVYLIGGYNSKLIVRADLTTVTGSTLKAEITPLQTHEKIGWASCVTVGNKTYIFGGSNSGSMTISPIDEVNVYSQATPVPAVEEGALYVKPQTKNNIFPIVRGNGIEVEIGVDTVYKGNAEGIGETVEAALYKDGEWVSI
jgi:hypothetical protein